MINPNFIFKSSFPTTPPIDKKISLQKLTGYNRSRWDEPIQVPQILYQKLKVQPPSKAPSSNNQNVSNNYPPSLIDYIKKAYNKCKDQSGRKLMQAELRQLISKNQNNLSSIKWETQPIPTLPQNQVKKNTIHNSAQSIAPGIRLSHSFKKQTIKLPSSYTQSLLDNPNEYHIQQMPSKTNLKSIKALQKLQEKYTKGTTAQVTEGKLQNQQKKSFRGFQDESQVKAEQMRQRYLSLQAQKLNLVAQKQAEQLRIKQKQQQQQQQLTHRMVPPPPPLQSERGYHNSQHSHNQIKNNSTNNFSNKSINNNAFSYTNTSNNSRQFSNGLQLVESIQPDMNLLKKTQKKPIQKVQNTKITRKQLNQIAKVSQSRQDLKMIAKRFTQFNKNLKTIPVAKEEQDEYIFFCQDNKIVGRSTQISKPYLRITHRPDPDTVRPFMILKQAFEHFKGQYKRGISYQVIISQLKSIRQDLTVQDIRNSFTVEVYQQNMKMSLFQDDSIQLKHCMTNLWQLYRQGIYNKKSDMVKFISYHFITIILQERYKELEYMLSLLKPEVLEQDQIQQTLKVKRFFILGNYRAFFDFYSSRDNVYQKLINQYIDKIRVKCLLMVCKTFGDKIKFSTLAENIGQDQDLLYAFAKEEGALIQGQYLMLKQSYEPLSKSQYLVVKKVTSLLG